MSEINEEGGIIKYEENLPSEVSEEAVSEEEEIRIWEPHRNKNSKKLLSLIKELWRFIALIAAFVVIFVLILMFIGIKPPSDTTNDTSINNDISAGINKDETISNAETERPNNARVPLLINETDISVSIDEAEDYAYSLAMLFEGERGGRVVIVHSHNSESISENISVAEAGEVLSQLLSSAGIACLQSKADHDSQSSFGAYERMTDTVAALKESNSSIVLVIDLHDSDSGVPLTFTVGTGENFGWRENLELAVTACARTDGIETALRILPDELGQNNGLLTLHIGICGDKASDEEARAALSAVAMSIINICTKNPP